MKALNKPVLITEDDMDELLEQVWPGGMTVIENSSSFGVEFILYSFVQFSRRKGMPIVIEDIFDTLPLYAAHLELMGTPINESDINVIKVGGRHEFGNVVGKVKFENDPYVCQRKLEQNLKKIKCKEPYIHLVLGLERLIALQEGFYSTYTLLNLIKHKLGNKESTNVYIVESSVLESLKFNPISILEDIATSVVEMEDEGELLKLRLKKSVFTLLMHKEYILVSPREILRWFE
jgi:hypothetical protein